MYECVVVPSFTFYIWWNNYTWKKNICFFCMHAYIIRKYRPLILNLFIEQKQNNGYRMYRRYVCMIDCHQIQMNHYAIWIRLWHNKNCAIVNHCLCVRERETCVIQDRFMEMNISTSISGKNHTHRDTLTARHVDTYTSI